MEKISVGRNSYGTLYGTVRSYTPEGIDDGPQSLLGYGLFFIVRESFDDRSKVIFRKWTGGGITVTNEAGGLFVVTWQSKDTNIQPLQYAYECFISPGASGGTYVEGTTQMKSIGSGIFEILKGVKYGTA